jgi:hypothetical protein
MSNYDIRTRVNYGIDAQFKRVPKFDEIPIIKTFKKYQFALEFILKEGDTKNVYYINDTQKWVWDNKHQWHETPYRQETIKLNNLVANTNHKILNYKDKLVTNKRS